MHVNKFGGETCASKRLQQYLAPTAANRRDGNDKHGWLATDGFLHDFSGARKHAVFYHGLVVSRCGGNWDAKHCEHDNKLPGVSCQLSAASYQVNCLFVEPCSTGQPRAAVPTCSYSITRAGCPHLLGRWRLPNVRGFCCRTAGVS